MWKTLKISDVCTIKGRIGYRGYTKRDLVEPEEGAISLSPSNIISNKINFTKNTYISWEKYYESPEIMLEIDDIVFCKTASIGKLAIVEDLPVETTLNPQFVVLKNISCDNRFLYYAIQSPSFSSQISNIIGGTAIPTLSQKNLGELVISLPPLAEQQRIVAKLDAAFAGIDTAIATVENKMTEISSLYENAITAEFINIDSCVEKKLSDVCEKITDGTHQTPKYFEEGYIFLSSKNVTSRKIDWENVRYIDESQHLQMQKRIAPRVGDILLAKNGTTGVAAIVDRDVVFDIYVSLAWLRSIGDVLPEYLLEYVNSKMAREQFNTRTKGIGVPNLHLQEIREVVIRFPKDKEKQKIVVKKLKNIDDACNTYKQLNQQKLQYLVSLKSALLSQELQELQREAA